MVTQPCHQGDERHVHLRTEKVFGRVTCLEVFLSTIEHKLRKVLSSE